MIEDSSLKVVVPEKEEMVDPDVMELCEHFHVEEHHVERLDKLMKKRRSTFEEDMLKLWEKMSEARNPLAMLMTKLKEMEDGTFVGTIVDKDVQRFVRLYNIDDQAEKRLTDILVRWKQDKRAQYVADLERHLEVSARPSATVMMLLKKLGGGEALPKPGPVQSGSYLDRQFHERRDDNRDRARDRDRRDDHRRDDHRRDDRRDDHRRGRSRSRRR